MMLSENFSLDEFLRSQVATRNGIDMTPNQMVTDNLQALVTNVMQPIRTELKASVIVTSGFRPTKLNTIIGGSKTSAHRFGRACDFHVIGWEPIDVCDAIKKMDIVYDQLIHEFGRWIHIGIAEVPRQQDLTATRVNGQVKYLMGIQEVNA